MKKSTNLLLTDLEIKKVWDFSLLKDSVNEIEDNIDYILTIWLSSELSSNALKKYSIQPQFFKKYFATKILQYFIWVIKEENKAWNCPVVSKMLSFFNNKQMLLNDVYFICSGFKNALNEFVHYKKNFDLNIEINNLFDLNFSWVIDSYLNDYFISWMKEKCSLVLDNVEWYKEIDVEEKWNDILLETKEKDGNLLSDTGFMENINRDHFFSEKISAEEFYKEYNPDPDIIDDLTDLEESFEALFYKTEWLNIDKIKWLQKVLEWYSQILYMLSIFNNLNNSVVALIDLLSWIEVDNVSLELDQILCTWLKWVFDDLVKWKKDVFIIKNTVDVNCLDDSLLSSIKQIENYIAWDNAEYADMEYF